MSLSFCSFSSGSSGNCYLIKTEKAAVLIDAGISASRILKELGRTDTPREHVRGLFLTHEHHDHVAGVCVLMKKLEKIDVFASPGTLDMTKRRRESRGLPLESYVDERRFGELASGEVVAVGDMAVYAFRTLHDAADPYGYYITSQGKSIAIITDTGIVTEEIVENIADADVLVLESNHDTDLLRRSTYPSYLKQRILGEHGHLSNGQAADALLRLFAYHDKKRVVLLAHLSSENNTPAIAERTVLMALARENRYTGSDLYMGVLPRGEASLLYHL